MFGTEAVTTWRRTTQPTHKLETHTIPTARFPTEQRTSAFPKPVLFVSIETVEAAVLGCQGRLIVSDVSSYLNILLVQYTPVMQVQRENVIGRLHIGRAAGVGRRGVTHQFEIGGLAQAMRRMEL